MNHIDRFIIECTSFDEFRTRTSALPTGKAQGDVFERLTQLYLQTEPEYRTALTDVWLRQDIPARVLTAIGMRRRDRGIDLIARHNSGSYWAIQAKFRTNAQQTLGWNDLATFNYESAAPRTNIRQKVVSHTVARPVGLRELMGDFTELGLDRFRQADWLAIVQTIRDGQAPRPKPSTPTGDFAWQQLVVDAAVAHFRYNARGRAQLPCGTGKSLLAYFIANALEANSIIVAVPSLNLVKQTVRVWMREEVARGRRTDWRCVASDDTVGKKVDDIADERPDLGLQTTTDIDELALWLQQPARRRLVFTTYQSSAKLAEAAKRVGAEFDLVVCDEAHRTVGARNRDFVALIHDHKLQARRRLFMTATERRLRTRDGDIDTDVMLSMDDAIEDYGARFFTMSFREAIDRNIICDYQIFTMLVRESAGQVADVEQLIKDNTLLNLDECFDPVEAFDAATAVATRRAMQKKGITHPLVFNSCIRKSKAFRSLQDKLNEQPGLGPATTNFHVDSGMSAGAREEELKCFIDAPVAIMSNARCLTEGVDVPAIDGVVFASPKRSVVDIVQAFGRALRQAHGKERGYVVIPVVVPDGMDPIEFVKTTRFKDIIRIIAAISTQDERIVEDLRARFRGLGPSGGGQRRDRMVDIGGEEELVGFGFSFEEFAPVIDVRSWQRLGPMNPPPFEELCEFARELARTEGVDTAKKWYAWCKTNQRPDIPYSPDEVYAGKGWSNWPHFLGTDNPSRNRDYLPYDEARPLARAFAREHGISGLKRWAVRTDLPDKLPRDPDRIYRGNGWTNSSDWLGTNNQKGGHMPFAEYREIIRSKGFENVIELRSWLKTQRGTLPAAPNTVYKDEFQGWNDLIGKEEPPLPLPWLEARAFMRTQGLKSQADFVKWRASDRHHPRIPTNPNRTYAKEWNGWPDFLGYHGQLRGRWPAFPDARRDARAAARAHGVNTYAKWMAWRPKDGFPVHLPRTPNVVYQAEFTTYPDWLGVDDNE